MAPIVKCPTCGTPVVFDQSSPFRPFCSERCRLVDLGEWATERYAIPCEPDEDDPDAEGLEASPPGWPDETRH